jgi:primase-polymerase (primpol)-like protein
MITGQPASSTDERTWTTFADASASSVGAGAGFVLNGDGIICVDLDHCLVDGEPVDWVRPVLELVPATYVEVSPSGDGLHIWGLGRIATGRRLKIDGGQVEIYGNGRYLTVTGQPFSRVSDLADLQPLINALLGLSNG